MKLLVEYFVDGTEVDFDLMLLLDLIKKDGNGFSLSNYGKSFLSHTPPI
jgi:hypothetical protein